MTFAMLPTTAVLTLMINAPLPDPPSNPGAYDAAPDRAQIYVEEVECVTLWRGRQRRTYCRVIHRGPVQRPVRQPAPQSGRPLPLPLLPNEPLPNEPLPNAPPPPPPALVPPPAPSRTLPNAGFLTSSEGKVMRLLNAMRRRLGLRSLALDKAATRVARAHSQDMCRRRYFAHKNLDGKMPWDRLKSGGVKFRAAGENIAAGQATASEVHKDWNTSPGHRKNRLNKRYRRMGIGVYWCAGVPYWTEVFMH